MKVSCAPAVFGIVLSLPTYLDSASEEPLLRPSTTISESDTRPKAALNSMRVGSTIYLFFLIIPLFVLFALLWVASTDWFMAHNAYPTLRGIGYELRLDHEDCDVVLYGDSSALTGYDPAIIESLTELKTCNVSEGGTILSVVGPFPLDSYLRRNKRPKFLVMMFTPSTYKPSPGWMDEYKPEGYVYLLRYVRGWRLVESLLKEPNHALEFATWVGLRLADDFGQRLEHQTPDDPSKDAGAFRFRHQGLGTFPLQPETHCIRTAFHYRPQDIRGDLQGVSEARQKYGVGGTQVFINVAPVPTCDALQDTYRRVLEGEHDNRFEALPIEWFNSEDVHFDAAGQKYLSTEVANQILTAESHTSIPSRR